MKAPDTQEITSGSDSLSAAEQNDLLALEATIEAGQETFLQVGAALLAIRDRGLYRERFETFTPTSTSAGTSAGSEPINSWMQRDWHQRVNRG